MIQLQQLTKRYTDTPVLNDISFTIGEGEVISIIGPSGSGKSTLLRTLNGLETPDTGTMCIGKERLQFPNDAKTTGSLRFQSSMVFQQFHLFPHLTVLQNVTLGLTVGKKASQTDALQRANHALRAVQMEDYADRYPNALSGGQAQRVGIARAVVLDTPIILFDEPTSALDPSLTTEVLESIRQIQKLGRTMVIVTHEIEFAKSISHRIFQMNNGVIADIYTAPHFDEL
ncbi:MAG: amino acid ABC transporter ATP-binding protein [Bacilli bacterium]